MKEWRLLDTGSCSAAENMALDDAILECRAKDLIPDTIRFLQFNPPAVLVGHHQSIEQEVRTEFCRSRGIDINRRLTGGGAIFFDTESLGWEIIASRSELDAYRPAEELYQRMCEGTILGLKALGIEASFRPRNDIEVKGRKISGTGGTARDDAFLFQGTLLIDFDVDTMIRALRIPVMKLKDKEIESVRQRVSCIRWELKRQPTLREIKRVLKEGFEEAFKVRLAERGLTDNEKVLIKDRLNTFQSEEWIFLDRRPLDAASEVSALRKTPGGLIRVSLAIDRQFNFIKSALITGDFFVFPSEAIMDLEAKLKGAFCDAAGIQVIVDEFFESTKAQIPGVTSNDLVKLILEVIGKRWHESMGISSEEANHIYPVNGDVMKVLDNGFEILLLPYCAKPIDCEYRRREGCVKCGRCSIGRAYELAEKAGLAPITIQSFEHLMATLGELKRSGVRGYIGCCCEGFYCKHQDDLEAADVPGVLIDINDQTCYELGKEAEALNGTFESQTELKFDLLSRLVFKARRKTQSEE